MNLKRNSPLLERESKTIKLDLAPEPWNIMKCVETGIVFLENPPGYEALKEDFAWEKTYVSEVKKKVYSLIQFIPHVSSTFQTKNLFYFYQRFTNT